MRVTNYDGWVLDASAHPLSRHEPVSCIQQLHGRSSIAFVPAVCVNTVCIVRCVNVVFTWSEVSQFIEMRF
jgi:hypothetical protein